MSDKEKWVESDDGMHKYVNGFFLVVIQAEYPKGSFYWQTHYESTHVGMGITKSLEFAKKRADRCMNLFIRECLPVLG